MKSKRPNQFQRTMIAMEKAGAMRKDGKSTKEEFNLHAIESKLAASLKKSFPTMIQAIDFKVYENKSR